MYLSIGLFKLFSKNLFRHGLHKSCSSSCSMELGGKKFSIVEYNFTFLNLNLNSYFLRFKQYKFSIPNRTARPESLTNETFLKIL